MGARLLYPDDTIQHAGAILGGGGVAKHAHKGLPRDNHGYFCRAILAQELSAVTAAVRSLGEAPISRQVDSMRKT